MPIKDKEAIETITFVYENEIFDDYRLKIQYHHTDVGPTISIFTDDETSGEEFSFPYSLFEDVVNFISARNSKQNPVVTAPRVGIRGTIKKGIEITRKKTLNREDANYAGTSTVPTGPIPGYSMPTTRTPEFFANQEGLLSSPGAIDESFPQTEGSEQTTDESTSLESEVNADISEGVEEEPENVIEKKKEVKKINRFNMKSIKRT